MSSLLETTDYSQFQVIEFNRVIKQSHVCLIKQSIQKNNLLRFRPILVDSNKRVIDGQHRLEAARQLGVPIFYVVSEEAKDADMISLNSISKAWRPEDYLKYYVGKGIGRYIVFQKLLKQYKITVSNLLVVIYGGGKKKNRSFYLGELKEFNEQEVSTILDAITFVFSVITDSLPSKSRSFLSHQSFFVALAIFIRVEEVEFDIFLKKLRQKLNFLRPASTTFEYIEILETIYNFRAKERVQISKKTLCSSKSGRDGPDE